MKKIYPLILILFLSIYSCTEVKEQKDFVAKDRINKYFQVKNGNKEEVLAFVKETDSLFSPYNSALFDGINNYIKGYYFIDVANFKLAISFLSKAENDLINFPEYDSLRFASYLLLSDAHTNLGSYDEGMKHALKAKEGYEKKKLPVGIYHSNISISQIFQAMGETQKAKEFIRSNIQVSDTNQKLKAMHLLANIYGEEGKLDSALMIDNEILANKSRYSGRFISPFLNNKALCLLEKKQYDSALYYFEQSLLLDSAQGTLHNMAANYSNMGNLFVRKNDFKRAKYYSYKSVEINKATGKKLLTLYSYRNLYQLYRTAGDYPQAILYGDSISALQKELDNVALNTNIEELNMVYETSKKEKKIHQQQNTIERNKILFSAIALILLLTFLFVYYYYRQNKLKTQLEKTKIQQENEKAILEAEQKERERISRNLHDNMGAYTSALLANIEKLKLKNINATELEKMQDNGNQILSSLRETIWILNNKEVSLTDFSDGFKTYCFKVLQNFENINFNAEENIKVNKKLAASTAIHINHILQEAVQNSIKHSGATTVNYAITCDDKFEIEIGDDGIGFDIQKVKKGNGLDNMEWRSKEAGVSIKYKSKPGKGTKIIINEI